MRVRAFADFAFVSRNHLLVKHPTDASKSILHVVARPAESTKLARDALRAFHGLFPAELVDFVREEGDDLHALAFHFACWNRYGRLSTNAAGRVVGTGNGGGVSSARDALAPLALTTAHVHSFLTSRRTRTPWET